MAMCSYKTLPQTQIYNSIYTPVQVYDEKFNKIEKSKKELLKEEEKKLRKELHGYQGRFLKILSSVWKSLFSHFGEEWTFLTILGIIMALISYTIDKASGLCNSARLWLYYDITDNHPILHYFAWISLPILLIMFGAGFVNLLSPKAAGSGIPEIKTILRGFYVEDFLTFRTLLAKLIGLTAMLGTNMPLGKEGPLIHISSIIATLMGKFVQTFKGIYENDTRKIEILGAACAVGVACTFAAPIGGVLLSIEITTSYYAVRNYWRGFCAAIWATIVYRLLYVWIDGFESTTVVFKTSIFVDTPFAAQELMAFAILGAICGLGGAFYTKLNRIFARYQRNSKIITKLRQFNFFIYPAIICLIITTVTYPKGTGKYLAGHLLGAPQMTNLFSNFTWTTSDTNLNVNQQNILNNWTTDDTNFYLNLIFYILFNCFASIIATTIPVPNGCFSPTLRMGAACGRILGELMHSWYPNGLNYHGRITRIMPGGYAIVGAAAFGGAVTQTMSVCVIILEMTSQITHVIPILMAVLISNCISQLLGPSIFNSVIKVKKLPYLPDLLPSDSEIYNIYVEDFMIRDFKYISNGITLEKLINLLKDNKQLKIIPLVNNNQEMILIGSIQRHQLISVISRMIGRKSKMAYIEKLDSIVQDETEKFISNPLYQSPFTTQKDTNKTSIELKTYQQRICDLNKSEQKSWQKQQMQLKIDFNKIDCQIIDPAPFQLVERTSLLKVHTLFSMVGITVAYVTSIGRLIGVVDLRDLRQVIDDVKNGVYESKRIRG